MRIFLDANILFSAAKSDGAVRQLLKLLTTRGHELCVDDYVVIEARRNLVSKADAQSIAALDLILSNVKQSHARVAATSAHSAWLPEKDRPVLDAAISLKCEALVTGDRTHFGAGYGKSFGSVTIYSPRLLAEALLE